MSATREVLIASAGEAADAVGLVGRGKKLPSYWLGDAVGGNEVFPDAATTGRQLYRLGYTAVSFATLGGAFATYLSSHTQSPPWFDPAWVDSARVQAGCFAVACGSTAASTASLANPSPLSLVPGFEVAPDKAAGKQRGRDMAKNGPISPSLLGVERVDGRKLEPRGLTRLTRHPLILPVVPWGLANSVLAGGGVADVILFGGLAVYAVCGCLAQDARAQGEEEVGTVFGDQSRSGLGDFFATTSFLPFGAVLDGRQNLSDIVKETPWIVFAFGFAIAPLIESRFLEFIQS